MKKVTIVSVSLLIALTFTSAGIYTYVQWASQPPGINATNWSTADNNIYKFMPLEYVNFSLQGHNVTMVAQLDTPYGNATSNSVFSEQVNLIFVSNDTSLVFHPRATIDNESLNGTMISLDLGHGPNEYVFYGTLYQLNYNGLATVHPTNFPKQVSANVTVTLSATFGPYWYVQKTFLVTF